MAEHHSTNPQIDAGALEDWFLSMRETVEAISFCSGLKTRIEPIDGHRMLEVLRLLNRQLQDRLADGHERFVF